MIRRPPWSNVTLPSISEKIVQSRPTPTFLPGCHLRAVLPAEDAARLGDLAAEELDSQHLRIRVAAVAARALSFFVSHGIGYPENRIADVSTGPSVREASHRDACGPARMIVNSGVIEEDSGTSIGPARPVPAAGPRGAAPRPP